MQGAQLLLKSNAQVTTLFSNLSLLLMAATNVFVASCFSIGLTVLDSCPLSLSPSLALFCFFCRPQRPKGQETTPSLVLGLFGLSHSTTEADLLDLFNKFGEVDRLTLIYDKQSGESRGFGFMSVVGEKRVR
jgi:hypothetical protein